MRLTQFTDYGLRTLIYLGLHERERCTIHEIADHYRISENHLMKVVNGLVQLGYVEGKRGRNGGLRLARPPEEIGLGAVVRDTEDDMVLVECFDDATNTCAITDACALRHMLGEARDAFLAVLDRYKLSDLLRPRTKLVRLLKLSA